MEGTYVHGSCYLGRTTTPAYAQEGHWVIKGICRSSAGQNKRQSDFWLSSIPEGKEAPTGHQRQEQPVPLMHQSQQSTSICSAPATVSMAASPLQKAPNSHIVPAGDDTRRAVAKADDQQRHSSMCGRWNGLLKTVNADGKMLRLSSSKQDAMDSCVVAARRMDRTPIF